jgi:hypothetical protein
MPLRTRDGRRLLLQIGAACFVGAVTVAAGGAPQDPKDDKNDRKYDKPSLSLRVSPPIAFSPARIVVTAELKGGAPDDPELYCPNVEWDWGDGTRSEATENCEPFEDGKSTVKRRWTTSHTFDMQGTYRVVLRLKRGPKTIVAGNNTVQVKPGVRDMSPEPY